MEDYRLEQSGQEVQDILNGAAMQTDLTAENERAEQAEQTLQGNIDDEETRAKAAEKQNADDIDAIEEKIPSGASAQNKLVDHQTMNSSIATATATYRGAYNLVSDLGLTVSATEQQIAEALATKMTALSITPDNNDYCYVQVPTSDATPTQIARVDRYKFNGTAWGLEYSLNNSGFTAAQWAAINSTITSGLVQKLSLLPTNTELTTMLNGKQNSLQFDNAPTLNSTKMLTSGAIYTAIQNFITNSVNDLLNYYLKSETYTKTEVNTLINAIKQFTYVLVQTLPTASADTMNKIYLVPSADPQTQNVKDEFITIATIENDVTTYAWEQIGSTSIDLSGYVTTTALNAALSGKQDILTIGTNMDNTPVASSGRPITSGGVKIAIDATREDLEDAIAAYNGNDVIVGALPASGQANKIYRVPGADSYTDYMYNSNDLSTPIKIAEFEIPLFESVSTHYSPEDCTFSGFVQSADGAINKNGTYHRTDYIPVTQGQIIKGSIRNGSSNVMDIACFDSNKVYVANSSANVVGTGNVDTFSVVVPEGVAYVIFSEPDNAQYSQFFSVDIITKGLFDNKNVLDKLSEQYGQLYYDGNPVMLSSMSALVCDLPVSDGTGISVGSAYIDSTTGVVKVKLQ